MTSTSYAEQPHSLMILRKLGVFSVLILDFVIAIRVNIWLLLSDELFMY